MIELTLKNAVDFKKSIDAVAVLIGEAEFVIDQDALTLKATDPSQISMVDFHLGKNAFSKFSVDNTTKIGVDLAHLKNIMSRAKAKDSLELVIKDKNQLQLKFKGSSTRSFSIPLIDVSSSELPTPKIEFDIELKMDAEVLKDGLKDSQLVSSHVTLGADAKKFFIKANSTKGTVNSETQKDEKSISEFNVKKECTSMFPLDYLADMLKGAPSDSTVILRMKANAPVKLSYTIGESSLTYFLAPRIESE